MAIYNRAGCAWNEHTISKTECRRRDTTIISRHIMQKLMASSKRRMRAVPTTNKIVKRKHVCIGIRTDAVSMPYRFTYQKPREPEFACNLARKQCKGQGTKQRCQRRVYIGFEFCWQHLRINHHLTIKSLLIEGAGLGLFSDNPGVDANGVVFRTNAVIFPSFGGIHTTEEEIDRRYGDESSDVAIYAVRLDGKRFVDAACLRGVLAHVNHSPDHLPNARLVFNNGEMLLQATKSIRNNREILIDYGEDSMFPPSGVKYATKHTTSRRTR